MARRAAARPDFSLESAEAGPVAGVDEAGRGPLAGPVLAGAVIFLGPPPAALAALLDDSKRLDAARREAAHRALLEARAAGQVLIGLGAASAGEIGRLNILRATHLAMARAVARLPLLPILALVDGNAPPPLPCDVRCVVGGDGLSLSIAAASIMAKVVRDRAMARLGARWPGYGFAGHAGYPTPSHREALARLGPCPHHRRGFAPVDKLVDRAVGRALHRAADQAVPALS
ncbi:ribonuclease HII [Muricoccus vinaceus]|uniref:Ribonuclease HII n=1 Tax=Muricoccus vinaceus TaxID=424704 RepID=A0ABV6IZC2_9PROT